MRDTKIEWCDSTWNPVTGCLHNCSYCYARRIATRFALSGGVCISTDEPEKAKGIFVRNLSDSDTGEAVGVALEFTAPYLDGKGKAAAYPVGFEPTFHRYRLKQPKCWHEPKNIFVCSMADLFGKWVPERWITEVLNAADEARHHRYLFLTKNPRRYTEYGVPMDGNKWYGTSITTAKEMERIHWLNAGSAFVSFEPLKEDVEPEGWVNFKYINWVIIGAETGNQRGKVTPEPAWIEKIVKTAKRYAIPVFMKNSLIPIVGEQGMIREFPWETMLAGTGKTAGATAAQDVLLPAT